MSETKLGGRFTLPGTSLTVRRMGYGAMQLAGPHVFGPRSRSNLGRRHRSASTSFEIVNAREFRVSEFDF